MCHMSHVVSSVTCHMSQVTCQTSPVTCHLQLVNNANSLRLYLLVHQIIGILPSGGVSTVLSSSVLVSILKVYLLV